MVFMVIMVVMVIMVFFVILVVILVVDMIVICRRTSYVTFIIRPLPVLFDRLLDTCDDWFTFFGYRFSVDILMTHHNDNRAVSV